MRFVILKFLLLLGAVNASKKQRRYLREELSYEARKALSQAVLSAIQSPSGEIDPAAMENAISKGISRESILKAAEIARKKTQENAVSDPRSVTLKDSSYTPAEEQGLTSTFPEQMSGVDSIKMSAGIPIETGTENQAELAEGQVSGNAMVQKAAGMPVTATSYENQNAEPKQTTTSSSGNKRRKFVEYQSCDWEKIWLAKVYDWSNKRQICSVLMDDQKQYVHLFLKMICTSKLESPHDKWCVIDDGDLQLWYNTENLNELELSWERPASVSADVVIPPPQAVIPSAEFEKVASKLVYLDEQTGEQYIEYIEPLVSHLRFPLSACIKREKNEDEQLDKKFKGFVIPPPPVVRGDRAFLYDTGSTSWADGLNYIVEIWKRHGIAFDGIMTYDQDTAPDQLWPSVPKEYIPSIKKTKTALASLPEEALPSFPFLPAVMKEETNENDYVVFKLDIDKTLVESRIIDFIINDPETNVDEIIWEHHITGNYLMYLDWPKGVATELNLRQSYEYFLRLRKKGIRAHSWI